MTRTPRAAPFVYISGGCRSGKSAYAQRLAEQASPKRLFLATAFDPDPDMAERIRLHRKARGAGWRVHEPALADAPALSERVASLLRPGEALLFDCLSLWVSACMIGNEAPPGFAELCDKLLLALRLLPCPVFLVGSEVGMGLVPESRAGRTFRDMAGLAGQKAAHAASSVIFMVSGQPLAVKGALPADPRPCRQFSS